MKRFLSLLIVVLTVASLASCGKTESAKGIHHATVTVKDFGTMTFELYGDMCPITVANFMDLAESGFYDGLTFHRMQAGFVLQGGATSRNGAGGSDETIKGEFLANGVENDLVHTKGVLSMARATDYDSATSQFFIVLDDSAAKSLDGLYAGFGKITDGTDVLDAIVEATTGLSSDSMGMLPEDEQPIIESIKILD